MPKYTGTSGKNLLLLGIENVVQTSFREGRGENLCKFSSGPEYGVGHFLKSGNSVLCDKSCVQSYRIDIYSEITLRSGATDDSIIYLLFLPSDVTFVTYQGKKSSKRQLRMRRQFFFSFFWNHMYCFRSIATHAKTEIKKKTEIFVYKLLVWEELSLVRRGGGGLKFAKFPTKTSLVGAFRLEFYLHFCVKINKIYVIWK